MSDVIVNTELTGNREDLVSEFRAAEQDAQQFVQRIGAMHADLPVTLNLAGATTALEAFIRQAQANGINIPISFQPTGGGSGGGFTSAADIGRAATAAQQQAAGMQAPAVGGATASISAAAPEAASIQPYGVVESGPYSLKPKAEIGKEFARITATRNIIEEEIEGVEAAAMQAKVVSDDVERAIAGMGSSSSRRRSRKGSDGDEGDDAPRAPRSRIGNGLYRYLSIAFAAREVIGSAIDARELGIEKELAGNDVEKQYAAEEGFIKKYPFTNLLLDPSGSQQIARQRTIESAKFGEEFSQRQLQLSQATSAAQREAGIADSGGLQREKLEAENRYTEESQRIENERRNDPVRKQITDEANSQRQQAQATRDEVVRSASAATASAGEGAGAYSPYSAAVAKQQVNEAEAAYQTALRAINETQSKRNAALDAKLNQQLQAAKDIRDVAIAHAEAAQDRLNTESAIRVRDIEGEREDIRTRETGNSADAEKASFARKLNDETDQFKARRKEAISKGDYEEASRLSDQISALESARPDRVRFNNRRIDQEQVQRNTLNQVEVGDISAEANEATLRGSGREREAAESQLSRSIDDRIAKLNAESKALEGVDNAESQRLANLAKATEATRQQVLDAQRAGYQRETQNNLFDIREATAEANLAAGGQRYESSERGADARFNREIRSLRQAGRNEEADEVEQEKVAARAARATLRGEGTRRINERADVLRLQFEHRGAEAQLEQLEEQHREELFEAGGDPVRQAAVNREHQERLRLFARQNVTGVQQTTARQAYFDIQRAVLGDPTGREAQSRATALQRANRELEHARPDIPPSLLRWNAAHGGQMPGHADAHGASPTGPAMAMADAVKQYAASTKDFKDAVDLMIAEAV